MINQLSLTCILNNMDQDLKEKVKTKLATVDATYHGGSLALFFICNVISNTSAKHAEYVLGLVHKMKVSQLEGKNIKLAINQMKLMLNILQNANHLPDDVLELLLKYFQSSSNKDFNDVFKALLNNYKLYGAGTAGTPQHISVAIIYSKALQHYKEVVNIKAWIKLVPKVQLQQLVTRQLPVRMVVTSLISPNSSISPRRSWKLPKGCSWPYDS